MSPPGQSLSSHPSPFVPFADKTEKKRKRQKLSSSLVQITEKKGGPSITGVSLEFENSEFLSGFLFLLSCSSYFLNEGLLSSCFLLVFLVPLGGREQEKREEGVMGFGSKKPRSLPPSFVRSTAVAVWTI